MIGRRVLCGFILAIAVGCVFSGEVAAAPVGVIDELDDAEEIKKWNVEPRDSSLGKVEFSNGRIAILRHPTVNLHDVAVHRTYQFPFRANTWIHVLVRQPTGTRIGADMYTDIGLNDPSMGSKCSTYKACIAEFNVNGEEGWMNQNGSCTEKSNCTEKDCKQTFHIGLAADNLDYLNNVANSFTWSNDIPVEYPAGVKIPYSQWTLYSVKYHVPGDDVPRWQFFVDGQEIVYRDIGNIAPEGQFQNVATVRPRDGNNDVSFRLAVLGDGDIYKWGTDYGGAIQRQCFSDISPFRVDTNQKVTPETARVEWDLLMIGNGRDGDFDQNTIKSLIYAGKIAASTAVVTDMILWRDAEFTCPFVSHDEIRRVRRKRTLEASDFCLARVKKDMYSGFIETADAILTDLISWQNAQFNCPFMSEEEKTRVRSSSKGSPMFCTTR